ncbi:Membrane associated serine protease, rhomboid family [Rhizobium sp. RU35A]|uniref:rhomboid family intramembrane serine protease n=1 Tax=Rhizobium sp. RU35A TaxID=1907414 RepID=UPI00095526E1|nr:rhomboid family intramembrane serine protease [Rhizobium sp. RU35A]SIQ76560.1 Membrane associated serine protease, rhomboid family [Rhizobium sp. RU35A]
MDDSRHTSPDGGEPPRRNTLPEAGADQSGQSEPPRWRPPPQPAFNLPTALTVTLALLILLYLVDAYVLNEDARGLVLFELAFTPLRYVYPLGQQGLEWLWTPVTYSLLHGGVEHIVFNSLWLTAFGAPVVRRIGTVRYVLFWMTSAAAAAFFHAALNWGQETLLIGASGVVSALMGAACRFAFPKEGGGMRRMKAHVLPRQGIVGALRNRTVLVFTLLWFFGNVLIAFGLPLVGSDMGAIAWDAHIGGFLFGYLLFGLFDPLPSESEIA